MEAGAGRLEKRLLPFRELCHLPCCKCGGGHKMDLKYTPSTQTHTHIHTHLAAFLLYVCWASATRGSPFTHPLSGAAARNAAMIGAMSARVMHRSIHWSSQCTSVSFMRLVFCDSLSLELILLVESCSPLTAQFSRSSAVMHRLRRRNSRDTGEEEPRWTVAPSTQNVHGASFSP